MKIKCKCLSCNHCADLDLKLILNEPYLRNLNTILLKIKCSLCNQNNIEVYSSNNELLYTSNNLSLCQTCGNPLILPRQRAMPNINHCVLCMENIQNPPIISDYKKFTLSKKEFCPKCNSLLVVRINSNTDETFIGCSNYPKCRYTKNK